MTRARTTADITTDAAGLPAGSVIQVVQTYLTERSYLNTTAEYDIPTATISITPQSTSSKILVMPGIQYIYRGGSQHHRFGLWRSIGGGAYSMIAKQGFYGSDASNWNTEVNSITYLDSPNTTSEVAYKFSFLQSTVTSGTYFNYANGLSIDWTSDNDNRSSITLMEIAG